MEIINSDKMMHDVGLPKFHSVNSITLGELMDNGIFKWSDIWTPMHAYNPEQYTRLCAAFEKRFYYREIGITPYKQWATRFSYELIYRLMPKYIPLYAQLDSGYDPLQTGGEYRKERKIESEFPETLLAGNQDYASKGYDFESETIGRGNFTDDYVNYAQNFESVDAMIINELETVLFSGLFTINVNGW